MEQLITLLLGIAPMSEQLIRHLRSIIQPFDYKKGDSILNEDEVCNFISYIETGIIRSFYKVGKEEVTNWFMGPKDIFISVISFHLQTPSTEAHMALKAGRCWRISFAQLEETFRLFPEFERHGRLLEAKYYCLSEERHFMLKRQSAEERYRILMKKHPDLHKYATNQQLASFLDMAPRTFGGARSAYYRSGK